MNNFMFEHVYHASREIKDFSSPFQQKCILKAPKIICTICNFVVRNSTHIQTLNHLPDNLPPKTLMNVNTIRQGKRHNF